MIQINAEEQKSMKLQFEYQLKSVQQQGDKFLQKHIEETK